MRTAVLFGIFFAVSMNTAYAQFPQMEKHRERMDRSVKASEDREHDRRLEEASSLPVPKPAVMNVDVQIVLSKADHKTFAEAKAAEAKKIVDGEPLWLFVKFKSKLGDYVLTTRNPDDAEKLRYTLYAEIGPRGDVTAQSQYTLLFNKEDLAATELKINLAPGLFGRNKSIPVFLMTSGAAKPGLWNNEFRLTNNVSMPRSLTSNLATAPVTLDFSGGTAKYKKMDADYVSIMLRGTPDVAKLPIAGIFYDEALKSKIVDTLAADEITPAKLYFSGDDWQEFGSTGMAMAKTRRVFATFTYQRGAQCFYGLAEARSSYDFMQSKFGGAEIKLQKDFPIQCSDVN
ncbi:MAG TPA: hypothetical protein VMZ26_16205 [Pyrinomonadaceae bacterium]|nr:hypothetical protein [Pyrinomonadaceae bacterium]